MFSVKNCKYCLNCQIDLLNCFFQVQSNILSLVDIRSEGVTVERLPYFVPALKHLCRLQIRSSLRDSGVRSTMQFLKVLNQVPLPPILRVFLRYF